ncbi:MAG: DUF2723 domain-containing protein [Anaerolineales bacterium]|nr:DUF2723 domain-containing protein [Anaerolineales bacterium]
MPIIERTQGLRKAYINKNFITLIILILTTTFYLYTLSPSLAWGDGVKLQSDAILGESFILTEMSSTQFTPDPYPFAKVGVAAWDHPLYIMLCHILVKAFPFVNSLWLVNFISAVFGIASVILVFRLCYQYTESLFASSYAALSLAVSHTFWWHSITPEVYTLFVFLLLLSMYFFGQFEQNSKISALIYSGFFLGLAASNHILAFLALPAWGLYILLAKYHLHFDINNFKKIMLALFGFLAGFSIYIVQFIRVSRSIPLDKLTGSSVGSTFLSSLVAISPAVLGESLLNYLLFLVLQFGPIGVILGVIGIRRIFANTDPHVRKIIACFIVFTFFGILYRVTDQFAFFLTSHVFFAMLMGVGLNHILKTLQEKLRLILTSILILTILLTPPFYHSIPRLAELNGVDDSFLKIPQIGTGVRNGFAYYLDPYKRGDFNAYHFGRETISNLAPNSIVVAEWYTDTDEYFVLRYFNKVEGLRSDVIILGWPTDDPFSFDSQLVLKVIEDSYPDHPIYLASLSDKFYASSTLVELFCIVPENNLYRLYPKEAMTLDCLGVDSVTE